jgi:hypothetical protein
MERTKLIDDSSEMEKHQKFLAAESAAITPLKKKKKFKKISLPGVYLNYHEKGGR